MSKRSSKRPRTLLLFYDAHKVINIEVLVRIYRLRNFQESRQRTDSEFTPEAQAYGEGVVGIVTIVVKNRRIKVPNLA